VQALESRNMVRTLECTCVQVIWIACLPEDYTPGSGCVAITRQEVPPHHSTVDHTIASVCTRMLLLSCCLQLLWELDNGRAVGLAGVPDALLRSQLQHTLDLLGLKLTKVAQAVGGPACMQHSSSSNSSTSVLSSLVCATQSGSRGHARLHVLHPEEGCPCCLCCRGSTGCLQVPQPRCLS
jgi:hypothetical protein